MKLNKITFILIITATLFSCSITPKTGEVAMASNLEVFGNIMVETHPNKDIRTFHFKDTPDEEIKLNFDKAVEIDGIICNPGTIMSGSYLRIDRYSFTIEKGKAYDWSVLQPKILNVFGINNKPITKQEE